MPGWGEMPQGACDFNGVSERWRAGRAKPTKRRCSPSRARKASGGRVGGALAGMPGECRQNDAAAPRARVRRRADGWGG
jgi:hypothetical protein